MKADTILRIRPTLTEYLRQYDDCFGRATARRHLSTYIAGQLGPLSRKSIDGLEGQATAGVAAR